MGLVLLRAKIISLTCRLKNSARLLITTSVTSFPVCSKFSDFCFSSLICSGRCRKRNCGGMIKSIWCMRWGGGAVSAAGGRRIAKLSVSNKGEWESICCFCLGQIVLYNTLSYPPCLESKVEKKVRELCY